MSKITFRSASEDDLETLYRFEQGIIVAERPFDVTLKPDPINYYDIAKMIQNKDTEVVVGVDGNKIVASAYAEIRPANSYLKHEQYAYLGFMFVEPDYRGKGINGGILDYLKTWIKSKGITEVRLDVYADNAPAVKAYLKAGFASHLLNMRLALDNN